MNREWQVAVGQRPFCPQKRTFVGLLSSDGKGRKHDDRLPRHEGRRFHLLLQPRSIGVHALDPLGLCLTYSTG
jgi:hypothetical protein